MLNPGDHHFRGLHQRSGGLAFAQLHFARGVSGDDGSDLLVADGQDDFGEQAAEFDFNNFAHELIASTHVSKAFAGLNARFGRRGLEERGER